MLVAKVLQIKAEENAMKCDSGSRPANLDAHTQYLFVVEKTHVEHTAD